ncbi:RseA family anti-sigma factor [Ramlibacter sp. PS3R-8]|uniref:RseA family anti-sigma factor n=1 Tax=Ramlibacter sp. PS3R-8 TaxID=3133437 RepID=UPI003096F0A8
MDNREMISALADGQLRGDALVRAVQAAAADAPSREAWCAYHLVGEVLRTGRAPVGAAPEAFLAQLRGRLQAEPAPRAAATVFPEIVVRGSERAAANDWRWKIAAGVASVAAVAAIGWNMAGTGMPSSAQPQLAAAPAAGVTAAAVQPASMIRDPQLDRLLAAHRQHGGATALQTSSGFLRNATFEGPAR